MKKLTVLFVAILFCFTMFSVQVFADPGDDTTPDSSEATVTNPEYPPPPDGYVGPWPTPDMLFSSDSSTPPPPPPTGDGGDQDPWVDPHL